MTNGRKQCDLTNGCGSLYPTTASICPSCGTSSAFSDFIPYNPLDWVYDLECYPNIFTFAAQHPNTGTRAFFEISEWRNDLTSLIEFLHAMEPAECRLIGFNNVGYDYPMLHFILENYHHGITYHDIYGKNQQIISTPWDRRFDNVVWDSDTKIPQIDLSKIHHFDNKSRQTSLKMLEFNMRMDSVEDLPFEPGTILTHEQSRELIKYNWHDIDATVLFYIESLPMIEFREQLSIQHGRNFLNHSDKKIGTDIFVAELEKNAPGSCYSKETGRRQARQTIRQSIKLADAIFPYIRFEQPEFNRIKDYLTSQTLTNFDSEYLNIKGIFKDLIATVDGFKYKFGSGGIHASIDSATIVSDENHVIIDVDVGGYYPELGTANHLYPEHLSELFCIVNKNLAEQRKQYKKGTALNNSIKLARNGAYGDSNNKYSPFYDPQYTLAITINGQLLLCMLAEQLIKIPSLQMIQCNTDGLTVRCPRKYINHMNTVCEWWNNFTQLELEHATYSRMFIRDVNNYIAEYEDGKLKSKGAYVHKTKQSQGATWTPNDMDWHQNYSALIVPMAAEAALVRGESIRDFITNHSDINNFMLRTKVGRADKLMWHGQFEVQELQRITRYYIAKQGGSLSKISPPAKGIQAGVWKRANGLTDQFYNAVIAELKQLGRNAATPELYDTNDLPWDERINTKNRSMYEIRNTSINAGYLVSPCNNIADANRDNINFDFYIKEAEKLVEPLRCQHPKGK